MSMYIIFLCMCLRYLNMQIYFIYVFIFYLILSMAFKKYLKYIFLEKTNIFVSDFSVIQEFIFLIFKIGLSIIYLKNRLYNHMVQNSRGTKRCVYIPESNSSFFPLFHTSLQTV